MECSKIKYLSLFSGVGGFELGIGDRGECVGYSEIERNAIKIYQKHFPNHKNYGDITRIDPKELPDFELLVGGFPCQSFSIAGKRGGFDDTRGTMFFEIARIVREKQPRILLLENVRGLLSHNKGRTFHTILSVLDELGYDAQWQVINSKNHGVPHNRERVFIIGHLRGTSRPRVFPYPYKNRGEDSKQVQEQRGGVLRPIWNVSMSPSTRRTVLGGRRLRRYTQTEYARLQGFPDNWFWGFSLGVAHKCAGNAVTVNVIRDLINKIYGEEVYN